MIFFKASEQHILWLEWILVKMHEFMSHWHSWLYHITYTLRVSLWITVYCLCCGHMIKITPCLQAYACVAYWNSFKAILIFTRPLRLSIGSFVFCKLLIFNLWFKFTPVKHPQSDCEASHNIWSIISRFSLKRLIGNHFVKHIIKLKAIYAALVFAVGTPSPLQTLLHLCTKTCSWRAAQ